MSSNTFELHDAGYRINPVFIWAVVLFAIIAMVIAVFFTDKININLMLIIQLLLIGAVLISIILCTMRVTIDTQRILLKYAYLSGIIPDQVINLNEIKEVVFVRGTDIAGGIGTINVFIPYYKVKVLYKNGNSYELYFGNLHGLQNIVDMINFLSQIDPDIITPERLVAGDSRSSAAVNHLNQTDPDLQRLH